MSEPTERKSSPLWNLTLIIFATMLFAGAMSIWMKRGQTAGDIELSVLMPRPVLKAQGWVNGNPPTNEELAGDKLLVINAWATWCGPCLSEMPHLAKVYEEYKDRVIFVGLTSDGPEHLEEIRTVLEQSGVEWVNGYGADETLLALEAYEIPTEYLAMPDGTIVAAVHGADMLEAAIKTALATLPQSSEGDHVSSD